jgi:hypothetical protein
MRFILLVKYCQKLFSSKSIRVDCELRCGYHAWLFVAFDLSLLMLSLSIQKSKKIISTQNYNLIKIIVKNTVTKKKGSETTQLC